MEWISTAVARELFECLLERVYSTRDVTVEGGLTDRERAAIDQFLDAAAADPEEDGDD